MNQSKSREFHQTGQLKTPIRALAKEFLVSLKSPHPYQTGEIAKNQWEKHKNPVPPIASYLNNVRRVTPESFSNWILGTSSLPNQ
jgi:hypothetical protein